MYGPIHSLPPLKAMRSRVSDYLFNFITVALFFLMGLQIKVTIPESTYVAAGFDSQNC